jgi:sugar phosphate isomerase/epimerase
MGRIICFSTGNMYQVYKNRYDQVRACSGLNVDGVEILIPIVKDLMKFRFKEKEKKKFRNFKHNTIHFPFWDKKVKQTVYLYNTKYCRRALEKALELAEQINAVNINLHAHQLKNPKLFDGLNKKMFSFENLEEKHKYKISDYKEIIKKYPEFRMLLDTSHGIRTGQLKELVSNFKDKIKFIHLSAAKGPKDDHYMLHRFSHPNKKQLEIVKKLNCPVIIEAGREKGLKIKDFKKEIVYVRKWLSS